MDLVDLIAEKRFLGQEFLTWLWFKSEERGGSVEIPGTGDIQVVFEKHMLLEYGEGEAFEKVVCQGLQAEMNEARTGLQVGKKLEQARIHLVVDDYEWYLTLKASLFEFRSVKLPKTMSQSEESDDPEALSGMLLDRIGLLENAVQYVEELFKLFLEIRLGSEWPREQEALTRWIKENLRRQ